MADEQDKDAGGLRDALAKALRSAVQLKIITAVGPPVLEGSVESVAAGVPTGDKLEGAAVTILNLLEGDIISIYSPAFITGNLTDAMKIHQDQVAKAEEIVKANVQLLKDMWDKGIRTIAPPAAKAPDA